MEINRGTEMKTTNERMREYFSRWFHIITVSFVILTIFFGLHVAERHVDSNILGTSNKSAVSESEETRSTFKIKAIHKRPLDSTTKEYKVLNITPELAETARSFYSDLILTAGDKEELWPASVESNPWSHEYAIKALPMQMTRMKHRDPEYVENFLNYAHQSPEMASKINLEWVNEDVLAPNMTDKETIVSLALMSSNAYVRVPYEGDWRNVSDWDQLENPDSSIGIGWDGDGVRGHIFANEDSSSVIIALKGTSAQGITGAGDDETTEKDKVNDNVLFSCCCARVSYLWTTACDCYVKSYTCDETCLEKELYRKDRYYQAVLDIYRNVEAEYPDAAIWITGHSLGGALASLLGRTFGVPAVAFEAPGELLATKRLHLPMPPGLPTYQEGIWHIGHTADPIFMGTCNGGGSSCSIAGYAMETGCHTGKVCVYDVVSDKGWHVTLLNHRIHTVIDGVLNGYEDVATCKPPPECHDCYNWNYVRGRHPPKKESSSKVHLSSTSHGTPTSIADTTSPEPTTSSCIGRNWIGICTKYGL